jgi:hypothetical protein
LKIRTKPEYILDSHARDLVTEKLRKTSIERFVTPILIIGFLALSILSLRPMTMTYDEDVSIPPDCLLAQRKFCSYAMV